MPEPAWPLFEHRSKRRVEWADTDLGGIIHFSRYFVFMETAEHEFLNALGSSVHTVIDGDLYSWPRLSAGFEFRRPVSFEDELHIRVVVLKKGTKSLTFGCELTHEGELVARGQMSSACCILVAGQPMRAVEIPSPLNDRIAEAPREERDQWQLPIRPL